MTGGGGRGREGSDPWRGLTWIGLPDGPGGPGVPVEEFDAGVALALSTRGVPEDVAGADVGVGATAGLTGAFCLGG